MLWHPYALWQTPTIWWSSMLTQNTIDPCLLSTDCAASWPLFEGHHMTVTTYDFPLSYSSLHPVSWLQFYKVNVACQAFLMGCTVAWEAQL